MSITTNNTPTSNSYIRQYVDDNPTLLPSGGSVDVSTLINGQHSIGIEGIDYLIYKFTGTDSYTNCGLANVPVSSLTPERTYDLTYDIPEDWKAVRVQIFSTAGYGQEGITANSVDIFGTSWQVGSFIVYKHKANGTVADYNDTLILSGNPTMSAYFTSLTSITDGNIYTAHWYDSIGRTYGELDTYLKTKVATVNASVVPLSYGSSFIGRNHVDMMLIEFTAFVDKAQFSNDLTQLIITMGYPVAFSGTDVVVNPVSTSKPNIVVLSKVPV